MIDRCTLERHPRYYRYGGRGVCIDPAWTGSGGFAQFLADMGERPVGKTLDRIEGDDHYRPGNCRWATPKQQTWNRACMTTADDELPPDQHVAAPAWLADPPRPVAAATGSDWPF